MVDSKECVFSYRCAIVGSGREIQDQVRFDLQAESKEGRSNYVEFWLPKKNNAEMRVILARVPELAAAGREQYRIYSISVSFHRDEARITRKEGESGTKRRELGSELPLTSPEQSWLSKLDEHRRPSRNQQEHNEQPRSAQNEGVLQAGIPIDHINGWRPHYDKSTNPLVQNSQQNNEMSGDLTIGGEKMMIGGGFDTMGHQGQLHTGQQNAFGTQQLQRQQQVLMQQYIQQIQQIQHAYIHQMHQVQQLGDAYQYHGTGGMYNVAFPYSTASMASAIAPSSVIATEAGNGEDGLFTSHTEKANTEHASAHKITGLGVSVPASMVDGSDQR